MLLRHSEIAKLNRPRSRVLNLFRTWFNGDEKARRHVPWAPDNYGKPDPVLDGVAQTALDDQADLAALGAAPSQDLLSKLLVNYWLVRELQSTITSSLTLNRAAAVMRLEMQSTLNSEKYISPLQSSASCFPPHFSSVPSQAYIM